MRIAIIGSGIAGMTAAHRLQRQGHDITVYEANDYFGGHTATVDVERDGRQWAIDTGFIVFNDWTYPNFIGLLEELEVEWQYSDMSFSLRCERTGLEYNGTSLNSLFAQRRNAFRPSFLRMIRDILRFNGAARELLRAEDASTLSDYLQRNGYSQAFVERYILPMGRAIWSATGSSMLNFPARFFVEFFERHGFLNVGNRPTWRTIKGGSREYARKLTASYRHRIRLGTPIAGVRREPTRVLTRTRRGDVDAHDYVVLACHSDQALRMLARPSPAECEILGAFPYQENEVLLHTDARVLPRQKLARAAWNYHLLAQEQDRVALTYDMNVLQNLDAPVKFLVTLNRAQDIDPAQVLGSYIYHHPVYGPGAVAAQKRYAEINGANRTFYCGAYWGYGFHEDGVVSARRMLAALEHAVQKALADRFRAIGRGRVIMKSCLYTGQIRHRRHAPRRNEFCYRIYMVLLDLDELPEVFDRFWLWSARRPALAWFRRGDFHGPGSKSLANAVRDTVQEHTGRRPDGPIRLLTHLRYFGYSFNPVSFYYVYDAADARVETIVAEITNTPWKQRHCYVLDAAAPESPESPESKPAWRWQFAKSFHVSPFMPMDMQYDWRLSAPGRALRVHMENWRNGRKDFDATLSLQRQPLASVSLARALCRFPLITLQVAALIHWQALKLLLKRVPFHTQPLGKET